MRLKVFFLFIIFIATFIGCKKKNITIVKSRLNALQIDSLILNRFEINAIDVDDSIISTDLQVVKKVISIPINYRFEQILTDLSDIFKKNDISISNSYLNKNESEYNLFLISGKNHIDYKFIYNKKSFYDVSVSLVVINFGLGNLNVEKKMLNLPINYTIAVLPYYKNSDIILKEARKNAKEIIINMPMEPKVFPVTGGKKSIVKISNYINNYGILARDSKMEIMNKLKSTEEYFSWNNVVGITNFRGYKIVRDREIMMGLMDYCSQRNYFFLYTDSPENSVVDTVSWNSDAKLIKYDYIIDDINNRKYISNMIDEAKQMAYKKGSVIIVAHPLKNSYDLIKEKFINNSNGIKFVYLSSLIEKGDVIW